jgi:type IX secretion system PorP/SprF family membrane protein
MTDFLLFRLLAVHPHRGTFNIPTDFWNIWTQMEQTAANRRNRSWILHNCATSGQKFSFVQVLIDSVIKTPTSILPVMKNPTFTLTTLLFGMLLVLFTGRVQAQQDAMFSQYMFNGLAINPAYAGSKDYLTAAFLHRNQWLSIPGAPRTNTISMHSPLIFRGSAVGGTLLQDRIGFTTQTDAYANYAYRIDLGKGARLALGLRAGISQYSVDFTRTNEFTEADPMAFGIQRGLAPNFGTGIYFDTRNFYLGLSVPRLLSYDPEDLWSLDRSGLPVARRHYFATIGYAIEAGNNIVIKPSVLAKFEDAAPFQADFNLNVLLAGRVWVGGSYRTGDAVVAMIEVMPSPHFQIGYAYDRSISELSNYNNGTHEIILTVNLGDVVKLKTPRYF